MFWHEYKLKIPLMSAQEHNGNLRLCQEIYILSEKWAF